MMCNFCGKLNDESHTRSKVHLQKVAEQAQLDVALGPPSPFRLRSLTPMTIKGLRCGANAQGFTQERILENWGGNVQSLCQFALDRFKAIGSIQLLKQVDPWNEKYKATLFLVSYSGHGEAQQSERRHSVADVARKRKRKSRGVAAGSSSRGLGRVFVVAHNSCLVAWGARQRERVPLD
jgi:hypothetical protein